MDIWSCTHKFFVLVCTTGIVNKVGWNKSYWLMCNVQGYGFVEFLGEEDADYSIKIMNMIKLYGKPIRWSILFIFLAVICGFVFRILALHWVQWESGSKSPSMMQSMWIRIQTRQTSKKSWKIKLKAKWKICYSRALAFRNDDTYPQSTYRFFINIYLRGRSYIAINYSDFRGLIFIFLRSKNLFIVSLS